MPSAKLEDLKIFTIGHSNASTAHILAVLRKHAIEEVVDVRSAPYSKYVPEFNRAAWSKTLTNAGIRYVFAGDFLGGRPKDPTCYRLQQGQKAASTTKIVDYGEISNRAWFLKGIDRLLHIASEHRTAIMCSEEDPYKCHRHNLITQTLLAQQVEVLHIRAHGELEMAEAHTDPDCQMSFFAKDGSR